MNTALWVLIGVLVGSELSRESEPVEPIEMPELDTSTFATTFSSVFEAMAMPLAVVLVFFSLPIIFKLFSNITRGY